MEERQGFGDPAERYDAALARLAPFGPEFGGGLSNHGPMALEALAHLGRPDALDPFLDAYLPHLEPTTETPAPPDGAWQALLAAELPGLVAAAGTHAGHGLLRTAHAVRSLTTAPTATRAAELDRALRYWSTGRPLASPDRLTGDRGLAEVLGDTWRLRPHQRRPGLLVHDLATASDEPRFVDLVASLRPAGPIDAIADRFDALALAAAAGVVANRGLDQFALLHGVTTSVMARVLLPHLDEAGRARLEAAVAGFVVAAVVAFDQAHEPAAATTPRLDVLVAQAVERLGDHDIKLADACAGLAERTGSPLPVQALAAFLAG